ncbi:hypothetical protein [Aquimarina algiphila]|uniref:hypothetical protein n=1 Tax=Aquimarina algiphila TaxID=2047982 RepID=UPI0024926CFF|nr:hypothetical protein [Aquimarina algiphila]
MKAFFLKLKKIKLQLWAIEKTPLTSRAVILMFFFLVVFWMYAQDQEVKVSSKSIVESKLTINDFAYPEVWWSTEQHSNFKFSYKVKSKFLFELQGDYDSYLLADVFKTSLITKLYLTDELYLFSGIELESERDKLQLNLPPPQLKYKNGFGYDVKSNFFIEVIHDLHFDNSIYGVYGAPSFFSVKGKYKF